MMVIMSEKEMIDIKKRLDRLEEAFEIQRDICIHLSKQLENNEFFTKLTNLSVN